MFTSMPERVFTKREVCRSMPFEDSNEIISRFDRRNRMGDRERQDYWRSLEAFTRLHGADLIVETFINRYLDLIEAGEPRKGKVYYDQAFCVADRKLVRETLLELAARRASKCFASNQFDLVWTLLELALSRPIDGDGITEEFMTKVFAAFSDAGVDFSSPALMGLLSTADSYCQRYVPIWLNQTSLVTT